MQGADRQPWACAEVVRGDGSKQRVVGSAERFVEAPLSHVALEPVGAARLLELVKAVTRPITKAIWLFVVLAFVRAGMRVAGIPGGDYITFAFVLYVVVLFASVTVVMALQWAAGPGSKRKKRVRLDLPTPGDGEEWLRGIGVDVPTALNGAMLPLLAHQLEPSRKTLRIRGRLDGGRGLAPGAALLVERWQQHADGAARVLVARPFLVVAKEQPPVLVELRHSAAIFADYQQIDRAAAAELTSPPALAAFIANQLTGPASASYQMTLRHGDEVELVATRQSASITAVEAPVEASLAAGSHYRSETNRLAVASCVGHRTLAITRMSPTSKS